jgi:hypothetical protein
MFDLRPDTVLPSDFDILESRLPSGEETDGTSETSSSLREYPLSYVFVEDKYCAVTMAETIITVSRVSALVSLDVAGLSPTRTGLEMAYKRQILMRTASATLDHAAGLPKDFGQFAFFLHGWGFRDVRRTERIPPEKYPPLENPGTLLWRIGDASSGFLVRGCLQ